jgi:hypothetical protein
MLIDANNAEARAIVGAMSRIAAAGGAVGGEERVTAADRASLSAAYRYLLRQTDPLDLASLSRIGPGEPEVRAAWQPITTSDE